MNHASKMSQNKYKAPSKDELKPSSWARHLCVSEKMLASMPYRHFRITIYENASQLSACENRYFYSPIALLDHEKAVSRYNPVSRKAEVRFRIELWNKNVESRVVDYLKKIVGRHVEDHHVQMIPFDRVLLCNVGHPRGYRTGRDWTPFQLHNSLEFSLICSSLQEADTLAAEMRDHPDNFGDFRLKFGSSTMASVPWTLNIRPECIRSGELVQKLQEKFPLADTLLLNSDDLYNLICESVAEVIKENIGEGQVVSAASQSAIRSSLENLLNVQRESTDNCGWDSVYWEEEDQRPDRILTTINRFFSQLEEKAQHQLREVLSCGRDPAAEGDGLKIHHQILKTVEEHRKTIEWRGGQYVTRDCVFYRVNFTCFRRPDTSVAVEISTVSCLSLTINVRDNALLDQPSPAQSPAIEQEGCTSSGPVGDFLLDLLGRGSFLNEEGATFLHLVLANCSALEEQYLYDLVQDLLDKGSDLNAVDNKGATVLHYAARYSLPEDVVLLILERGANLHATDHSAKTVLHYAARCSSSVQVIQLLLGRGSELSALDSNGATVLHSAASACTSSVAVIQLLLERGADIGAVDHEGGSVLHWAAGFSSSVDVIELLLAKGAQLKAVDKYGSTVLHYAAVDSSSVDVVRLLLDKGADLHAVDQEGKNVLHYAKENSSAQVVHFLRQQCQSNSIVID